MGFLLRPGAFGCDWNCQAAIRLTLNLLLILNPTGPELKKIAIKNPHQ